MKHDDVPAPRAQESFSTETCLRHSTRGRCSPSALLIAVAFGAGGSACSEPAPTVPADTSGAGGSATAGTTSTGGYAGAAKGGSAGTVGGSGGSAVAGKGGGSGGSTVAGSGGAGGSAAGTAGSAAGGASAGGSQGGSGAGAGGSPAGTGGQAGSATAGDGNGGSTGASGAGQGGSAAGTGGSGSGTCEKGQVAGNEVTFIGDSWVELPGSQVSHLEELAQEAGALEQGGRYDDRSKSGNTMAQIVQQYRANRNTKVLIMDGGGIDLIQSNNQQTATNMANAFTDFLAEVASDGNVQHIIYYLYPDIPGLAQVNFQLLEPGNRAACEASTVPCFFLPLKPIWNNSLMGGDNIHPSVQGGELIAEEVWKIMQENCIAQ